MSDKAEKKSERKATRKARKLATKGLFVAVRKLSGVSAVAAVESLLSEGARTRVGDEDNCTPLMLAIERRELGVVRALLPTSNLEKTDSLRGRRPIHYAAMSSAKVLGAVAKACADASRPDYDAKWAQVEDEAGYTALMIAASEGGLKQAKILLGLGADPKHENAEGEDALCSAVQHGNLEMAEFLLPLSDKNRFEKNGGQLICNSLGTPTMVEFLLEAGAKTVANSEGFTPLMAAAREGSAAIFKRLLACSDPSAVDAYGRSAMYYAVFGVLSEKQEVVAALTEAMESKMTKMRLVSELSMARGALMRHGGNKETVDWLTGRIGGLLEADEIGSVAASVHKHVSASKDSPTSTVRRI